MSMPISGGGNVTPNNRLTSLGRLKTTTVAEEATGLPAESFKPTGNPLKAGLMQGKLAKKLGGKAGDVQVRSYGITFKGKALENLRETALKMAAKPTESGTPPLWAQGENLKQLHVSLYENPQGPQEMDHPAGIITDPNAKTGVATQLGYLLS